MKQVTRHTITINPLDERYGQRSCTIALSTEFFTAKEIATVTQLVQIAAIQGKAEFNVTCLDYEIPESDEEVAEIKAKAEQEKAERLAETDARKELLLAQVIEKAGASGMPYTAAIEDALDTINSWESNGVRTLLKERNLYYLNS